MQYTTTALFLCATIVASSQFSHDAANFSHLVPHSSHKDVSHRSHSDSHRGDYDYRRYIIIVPHNSDNVAVGIKARSKFMNETRIVLLMLIPEKSFVLWLKISKSNGAIKGVKFDGLGAGGEEGYDADSF
mmetsp:Transcript_21860/g.38765  ORF Transcript_21860/g.38765 Transcript_21860/m.38765 type:complete len:130 (-) Transcript_21860:203-592(-)